MAAFHPVLNANCHWSNHLKVLVKNGQHSTLFEAKMQRVKWAIQVSWKMGSISLLLNWNETASENKKKRQQVPLF